MEEREDIRLAGAQAARALVTIADAEARGIRDGEWVQLTSRFGTTKLRAQFSTRVNAGVVYTTFHHAKSRVNRVTSDLSDWATNCPEYKVTAVEVTRVEQASETATAKRKKQKALEMA